MINKDRIVPITVIDLITMYGTVMKLNGTAVTAEQAKNPGIFDVEDAAGDILAAEPVKTFEFSGTPSSATVYFVPAYDYAGFTIGGTDAEMAGDAIDADGRTLYKAEPSGTTVTVTKIGF